MKMIWQLQIYLLILASLTSLFFTEMTARETSCNETCAVTCTGLCTANCDARVNHVPNECYAVNGLTIDDNVIHVIEDTTFQNFTRLTFLSMANNGIENISDNSFNRTKLTGIDLSQNHIRTLSGSVFRPLTNLTRLKLDHNELKSVALQGLSKLQYLSLSHNRISVLTRENFKGTNLTFLDLRYNEITALLNDCLGKLTNLDILRLSGNRIRSINRNAFHHLGRLRILKLDSNQLANQLGVFDGVIFEGQHAQPRLGELNLSNNKLTYLNKNMFEYVGPSIRKLTIRNNLISNISRDTFWGQMKITEIDLEGNKIGTNSQDAFVWPLEERTEIRIMLAGNSICDTYVAEFGDYYGTGIFCLPDQTAEYSDVGKVPPTPGVRNTPGLVARPEGPDTILIVVWVCCSILAGLIILLVVVRVKNKIQRASSVITNRGYNLPNQQQHLEHHQIPMQDAPPPPVPARNPTMNSGPYMNETLSSNSTQSYIQPSPATPSRGNSTHHNPSSTCHHHNRHPPPPVPDEYRSSPNPRTPTSETGSIVIVGINHGSTGTALMAGLPKPRHKWRRSLTRHLPGHYLGRRETRDGRPVSPEDEEETLYQTRHETIDGRPKHNTIGTATYKSVPH